MTASEEKNAQIKMGWDIVSATAPDVLEVLGVSV